MKWNCPKMFPFDEEVLAQHLLAMQLLIQMRYGGPGLPSFSKMDAACVDHMIANRIYNLGWDPAETRNLGWWERQIEPLDKTKA